MPCKYYGPDGKPSILFNELYNYHNGNEKLAVADWLTIFTNFFKTMHGDWRNKMMPAAKIYINGEPKIETVLETARFQKTGQFEADELVKGFAADLSKRFNVPVKMISYEQASEMLSAYSGQPAFYMNGTAYLVEGRASRLSAIHEIFGHPFLDVVEKENPALFKRLTEQALTNSEIETYVKQLYPEHVLSDGTLNPEGAKEAVIRAIELNAEKKLNDSKLLTLIKKFWESVERRLKEWLNISEFRPDMTIDELTDLALGGSLDLSSVQATSQVKFRQSTVQDKIYDSIRRGSQFMTQQVVNGIEKYINTTDLAKQYERLTEFTGEKFDFRNRTSDQIAEAQALKNFNKQGKNPDTDLYKDTDGKEYKFADWITQLKIRYEDSRVYGKIGHLYMELILGGDRDRIQKDIDNLTFEIPGVRSAFTQGSAFKYMVNPDNVKQIRSEIGVDENDRVLSEVILHSDLLGIATRADGIFIKPSGQIVLGDFKFGKLYNGANTSHIFKWATDKAQISMQKTRLNDARLEVAFRAMMLKLQNPDVVFEDLFVAHVNERRGARKETIMLQDYLDLISNYYKSEQPDVHRQLLLKGVFDSNKYWGKSSTLVAMEAEKGILSNKTNATYVRTLYDELVVIQNQISRLPNEYINKNEKRSRLVNLEDERQKLIEAIMEVSSDKAAQQLFTESEDISMVDKFLGNNYDVKNELAQVFFEIMREKKQAARDKIRANEQQYEKVAQAVLEEYSAKKGIPKILNRIGLNSLLSQGFKYHTPNRDGIYDFAYVFKDGGYGKGYYMITEADAEWSSLSQAQTDYIKFIKSTMKEQYKKAVGDRVVMRSLDDRQEPETKAKLLGRPAELEDDFMPRLPVQQDEYVERYGMRKGLWKKHFTDILEDYVDDHYNKGNKDAPGMPVKYMSNDFKIREIVENQEHSFDLETAYRQYMNNLYMVEELDEVMALGKGVQGWVQTQTDSNGKMKMANLNEFLEGQLLLHTTDTKIDNVWTKKSFGWTSKDGKRHKINFDRAIRALKTATTYATMWIQPLNAASNGGLILTMNHKGAIIGDIIKHFKFLKIDDSEIDYTSRDLAKAESQYLELQKDWATNNTDNNKLHHILKAFNYLPDSYDYAIRNKDKVADKNSIIDPSTPMFLNTIVEDFGSMTILASLLNHMKVETTSGAKISVMDAYELVEKTGPTGIKYKELQFRADIKNRGVVVNKASGEKQIIRELTSKEITTLKRISQRIHGAYRQDERSNAELYALGQFFLQFKKYLPTLLRNAVGSQYKDRAQGDYRAVLNDDGTPKLIDVLDPKTGQMVKETELEWYARLNEGRLVVFAKTIMAMLGFYGHNTALGRMLEKAGIKLTGYNKDYKWNNLTPEQKKAFVHMSTTLVFWATTLAAFGLMFDDDDKDKMIYRKAQRFHEDMFEGIAPKDLLRTLKSPIAGLTRLYNLTNASTEFLSDLITGERQKDGKLHGETTIRKNLPVFSSIYNIDKLMGESDLRVR